MADEVIGRSFIELLPKITAEFGKQVTAGVKQAINQATGAIDASVKKTTDGIKESVKRGSEEAAKTAAEPFKKQRAEYGRFVKRTAQDADKANEQIKQSSKRTTVAVGKSFGGLRASVAQSFKGIGGIVAGAFAGVAAIGFLKSSIAAASDLGETTSKVSVIFGKQAMPALQAYAKAAVKGLGQTQQSALDAAATFGIFGKSAGLRGKDLTGFSTRLVTLSSDLASFSNTSPAEAIEAIGAALRGEAEPIRKYGILIDDASTRQEALRLGIIKTTKNSLTPQQRVLAVQSLIFKQTSDAQGDFARTSGGLANQQRILAAKLSTVKVTIGNALLPIMVTFTTFLNNTLIPGIQGLADLLIRGDFTKNFREAFNVQEDSGLVVFLIGLRDWIIKAGVALQPIAKQVRDLAGFLLHDLVPAIAGTVKWFAEHKRITEAVVIAVAALVLVTKAHTAAIAFEQAGGFLAWLTTYLKEVRLVAAATKVWAAAQWALDAAQTAAGGLVGIIVVAIAALVVGIIYAYKHSERFRNIVNAVGNALKTALLATIAALIVAFHAVSTAVKVTISALVTAFNAVQGAITTAINAVIGAFHAVIGAFQAVGRAVGATVATIVSVWHTVIGAVSGPILAVIGVLNSIWIRIYPVIVLPFFIAKKLILDFWKAVQASFVQIAGWVSTVFAAAWAVVQKVIIAPLNQAWHGIQFIFALIRAAFSAVASWVSNVWSKVWAKIGPVLSGAVDAGRRAIDFVIGKIRAGFIAVRDWVVNTWSKGWNRLTGVLSGPIDAARRAISAILGAGKNGVQWLFSQAVTAVGRIWTGLQNMVKAPVKFVINTVLNDGLISAFNWIAGKFQAPTIKPIPLPPGFEAGGQFTGRLPGRPSAVDNMVGMAKGGAVGLATGEYIVNAKATAQNLPLLERINSGYADGGLFGGLKNAAVNTFKAARNLGGDVLDFVKDPVAWFRGKMSGPLGKLSQLGSSPVAEIIKSMPRFLFDQIVGKAKDLLKGLSSQAGFNPGLQGALDWARTQVGKPYIWGGVGPEGYDCSGFLSAIVNVIKGANPYSRLFSTGTLPAGLFDRGPGAFEVAWFTGNPGHTAGTLNGQNVESRGGRGALVGPEARGAANGLFNSGRWHLKGFDAGGLFDGSFIGDPPYDGFKPWLRGVTGFADGAWEILRNQLAVVHAGEMVVPAGPAGNLRSVLGSGAGGTPPGGTAGLGDVTVHVYVGDREITDIVDVRISENNRGIRRKAQAGVKR